MTCFETERLIIRRFSCDDWRDLYDYLSMEEAVRFEPYGVYTEDQCREEAAKRSQLSSFLAVCLKDGGKLIGNLYFQQLPPEYVMTWEIGYVFNPDYWGKGYATESCREIIRFGFEELKAHRIKAMCDPLNSASWRLLERLGMRREGHLHKNIYFKLDNSGNPIWKDTFEYAILNEEWG